MTQADELLFSSLLAAWRETKDFLCERLVSSGRTDVSIYAVLRTMNSAFDDKRGSSQRTEDASNAQTEHPAGRVGAGGDPDEPHVCPVCRDIHRRSAAVR